MIVYYKFDPEFYYSFGKYREDDKSIIVDIIVETYGKIYPFNI